MWKDVNLAVWFSALALAFVAPGTSAASVTNIVGTCKGPSPFSTIQSALDASPAPNTVEVCPGSYSEQVTISRPVTLEGIAASNGARAIIYLPPGYTANVTLTESFGATFPAVAQVYVNNVSGGAVNLTNLDVDGSGFTTNNTFFVGIVYQGSSGTINRVITANQNNNAGASNVSGYGMWIQGGSSKPSVTVENSSMHDFEGVGVYATGTAGSVTDLTVTIKNNAASSAVTSTFGPFGPYGIMVDQGSDPSVSGNVVKGGGEGIVTGALVGSITGNTIVASQEGIYLFRDGASVKSNNIFDIGVTGIDALGIRTSVVENNIIRSVATTGAGIGIDLHCNQISSGKVHSNTIMDSDTGYANAPAGYAGSNTYVSVLTEVGLCAH